MLRTAKLLHPASDPASRPSPGASLPGTLASPRTGLAPAGRRELLARLRHGCSFALRAPRAAGRTGFLWYPSDLRSDTRRFCLVLFDLFCLVRLDYNREADGPCQEARRDRNGGGGPRGCEPHPLPGERKRRDGPQAPRDRRGALQDDPEASSEEGLRWIGRSIRPEPSGTGIGGPSAWPDCLAP